MPKLRVALLAFGNLESIPLDFDLFLVHSLSPEYSLGGL